MSLTLDLGDARYPAAFLIALVLSLYLTPIIRRGAIRYNVLDLPDGKLKTHGTATPYLGGVAIYLSFLFALAFTYDFDQEVLGILVAASIVFTIGLFDDLKVLSPQLKLAGQIVAAFVLVKAGIMIRLTFLPDWMALVLTFLWLVGVTNAMNLIDVSDGLAAGVSVIAGLFFYIVALWNGATTIAMITLALVGATVGFLWYNRPKAKIFLGDTGSLFLGFMLAALAMRGHYTFQHKLAAVAPALILGVPIFDTIFVMAVRAIRGIPIMRGSPDHFAVRMRNNGISSARIAVVAYVASAILGAAAMVMVRSEVSIASAVLGGAAAAAAFAAWFFARMGRGAAETPPPDDPEAPEG